MGTMTYKSRIRRSPGTREPCQDCGLNDYQMEKYFVVADGVREYPRSDEASKDAVKAAYSVLNEKTSGEGDPKLWIEEAVNLANAAVFKINKVTDPEGRVFAANNAGTTLDIAVIHHDILHVGHIGDGRVYVVSYNSGIKCITQDHLYQGRLSNVVGRSESVKNMDYVKMPLAGCKWVFLTTDGIYKRVTGAELDAILKANNNCDTAIDNIMSLALNPSEIAIKRAKDFKITEGQARLMLNKERDDMTGILIHCVRRGQR